MAERALDILFVNADSAAQAYQELSKTFAAVEPPTWSLLLAQSCRSKGYGVSILDCTAEGLTHEQAVARIAESKPRLTCFVMYGQNPNSGTTSIIGNAKVWTMLRETHPELKTCAVGSHVSALPLEILNFPGVDFVLLNEGVYALHNLLKTDFENDLEKVKGIGFKREGKPIINPPERVVPTERMDLDLPGYAWDLLPFKEKPLDRYRAHFWHAEYDYNKRTPFAALYTSLGCRFKCDFCMINIVNRVDNAEGVVSSNSPNMRFWSPQFILEEFSKLAEMGVKTVRISDEMFFLNKSYYEPLLLGIIERGLDFRMWSYSRVDTMRPAYLETFRKAGIHWLGLGVEAGNQNVRREVSKGSFEDVNIRDVVKTIHDSGINVATNYIFGLPDDNRETMQETLDLALELNTEMVNMYPCQALPGSPLYQVAKKNGWKLPDSYEGYAFLSYESQPLPTKYLSSAEVLKFRDEAWQAYHTHEPYLQLVEKKFGTQERKNIEEMTKIKLKRKLLATPGN